MFVISTSNTLIEKHVRGKLLVDHDPASKRMVKDMQIPEPDFEGEAAHIDQLGPTLAWAITNTHIRGYDDNIPDEILSHNVGYTSLNQYCYNIFRIDIKLYASEIYPNTTEVLTLEQFGVG